MSKKISPFFFIGVPKSGTSSLYNYFSSYQDVSVGYVKELASFSGGNARGLDLFLSNHSKTNNILLDFSLDYCVDMSAIKAIKNSFDNPQFIIIFRSPFRRFFSHYRHRLNRGDHSSDLSEESLMKYALYFNIFSNVTNIVGRNNVHIFFFEELLGKQSKLSQLCNTLGIDIDPSLTIPRDNVGGVRFSSINYVFNLINKLSLSRFFSPFFRHYLYNLKSFFLNLNSTGETSSSETTLPYEFDSVSIIDQLDSLSRAGIKVPPSYYKDI